MYFVVCLTALLASGLTLFSGFGLGTILMPAFALFFPVEVAIAMTAVVHMANNFFKLALVGRHSDKSVLLRFAPPAILAALVGAWILTMLTNMPVIASYTLAGRVFQVTAVKAVIGVLLIGFALVELLPRFENMAFDRKYLPLGGIVSGFFGGLSGNQGALRSAFLIKSGLDKDAFIATGVVAAVLVDITRLSVYSGHLAAIGVASSWNLVVTATMAAFAGAFAGSRLLKKVTLRSVQILVGIMLIMIGLLLGLGVI